MKKTKSETNKKLKERYESKYQKCTIKSIKALCELSEKVIKLFKDYCEIVFKAKYKSHYGEGSPLDLATRLKIEAPKQMLQWLLIALAQVKAANTS